MKLAFAGTSGVDFARLAEYDCLAHHVSAAFADVGPRHLAVALDVGGRSATVTLHESGVTTADASFAVGAACLTQLFTATLILLAARDGRLAIEDELVSLLPAAALPRRRAAFSGVTVRQLLNHTHGLDGSRAFPAERQAGRRINAERLCANVSATPALSEPGDIYWPSQTGPYLAAAILEHIFDQQFEDVLREQLFQRIGLAIRKDGGRDCSICPATGGALWFPVADLQKFLIWTLREAGRANNSDQGPEGLSAMFRDPVPIHGPRLERGSALGWNWYGDALFGDMCASGTGSALVRIDRRSGIALALADSSGRAVHATARLFRSLLPDFGTIKLPSLLSGEELVNFEPQDYVGWYDNAATSVLVERTGESQLQIYLYARGDNAAAALPVRTAALRPCSDDLFMIDSSAGSSAISRFFRRGTRGFEYFENGRELLRRRSL